MMTRLVVLAGKGESWGGGLENEIRERNPVIEDIGRSSEDERPGWCP